LRLKKEHKQKTERAAQLKHQITMKKAAFTLLLVVCGLFVQAQTRDFDGIWTGTLTTSDNKSLSVTLYIEDNNVYSVTEDEDGERIKDRDKEVSWSKGYGEQLNYVWMNKGGVWTETQTYSLVWINENKLSVYFFRHVSNLDDSGDKNTDWGYTATGSLYKE
jgi:hypothetical protein